MDIQHTITKCPVLILCSLGKQEVMYQFGFFFLERVRAHRVQRGQVLGLDSVMPGEWDFTFACILRFLRKQAREASCVVHLAAELYVKVSLETCWIANFILHTHSYELILSTGFLWQPSKHCDHTHGLGSNLVLACQQHN